MARRWTWKAWLYWIIAIVLAIFYRDKPGWDNPFFAAMLVMAFVDELLKGAERQ
jgi:hypothetical protein